MESDGAGSPGHAPRQLPGFHAPHHPQLLDRGSSVQQPLEVEATQEAEAPLVDVEALVEPAKPHS